jgi:hypothetical protein
MEVMLTLLLHHLGHVHDLLLPVAFWSHPEHRESARSTGHSNLVIPKKKMER